MLKIYQTNELFDKEKGERLWKNKKTVYYNKFLMTIKNLQFTRCAIALSTYYCPSSEPFNCLLIAYSNSCFFLSERSPNRDENIGSRESEFPPTKHDCLVNWVNSTIEWLWSVVPLDPGQPGQQPVRHVPQAPMIAVFFVPRPRFTGSLSSFLFSLRGLPPIYVSSASIMPFKRILSFAVCDTCSLIGETFHDLE